MTRTGLSSGQAERAILAEIAGEGAHFAQLEEGQRLKQLEDLLTDVASALDALLDVCNTLSKRYTMFQASLQTMHGPTDHSSISEPDLVSEGLQEKITDLQHYLFQAESLRTKVKSASDLVRHSSESARMRN